MNCEHKWDVENIQTWLPDLGKLIHSIVLCLKCRTVKKPLLFGDYVLEGSQAEKDRDDSQEKKASE